MNEQFRVLWGSTTPDSEEGGSCNGKLAGPGPNHSPSEGGSLLCVTFALCCSGRNASGIAHTVWVPTFQRRHEEVRKHLEKEHRGSRTVQNARNILGLGEAFWVTKLPK